MSYFDRYNPRHWAGSLYGGIVRRVAQEVERVKDRAVKAGESRTGRQDQHGYGASSAVGCLPGYPLAPPLTDDVIEAIDRDPTMRLAMAVLFSPIQEGEKSYEAREGTPDEWVRLVQASIDPLWDEYLANAKQAVGYGRKPFEVIYGPVTVDVSDAPAEDGSPDASGKPETPSRKSYTGLVDLKPLDPRRAEPLAVKGSGEFAGLRTTDADGRQFDLEPAYSLNVTVGGYVRNPYGESWYAAALDTWWAKVNTLAELAKLGQKATSMQGVMYHPPEATTAEAKDLLNAAMRGEGVVFPNATGALNSDTAADYRNIQGLAESALWKYDLVDHGQTAPAVTAGLEKLAYFNAELFRSICQPERSAMQGEHGTQAEAGEHRDVGLSTSQLLFDALCRQLQPTVNRILIQVGGPEAKGAVTLKAGKLRDVYAEGDWKVIDALLTDPAMMGIVAEQLDLDAIVTRRGLPKNKAVADFNEAIKEAKDKAAAEASEAEADAMAAELEGAGAADETADDEPAEPLGLSMNGDGLALTSAVRDLTNVLTFGDN